MITMFNAMPPSTLPRPSRRRSIIAALSLLALAALAGCSMMKFGYGQAGGFAFRTIRPVAYSGRTPHIHFAVKAPQGRELVTQMYVAGEPLNGRDGVYAGIRDPRQREAVTVALAPGNGVESGALVGTFDIVL